MALFRRKKTAPPAADADWAAAAAKPKPPRFQRLRKLGRWLRTQFRKVKQLLGKLWTPIASKFKELYARAKTVPGVRVVISFLEAVTAVGWTMFFLAPLMLILGLTQGWREFIAAGLLGIVTFVLALGWALGRVSYEVEIELASRRVVVAEPALGRVVINNPARRIVRSARIEMPVGKALASFHVPTLQPQGTHEEVFTIPTRRRGLVTVGPVESVRGDALGLLRRVQTWTEPKDLYIHPRTVRLAQSVLGFLRDVEGAITPNLSAADVSFHALRDYVAGDDRRNVHWKTTARTGKLMVRQFEETRRAHLLAILSLDAADWADQDSFEIGVSVTGSMITAAQKESKDATLYTSDGPVFAPTPMRVLDALTVVDPKNQNRSLSDLTREAITRINSASVVALVVGDATPINQVYSAVAQIPPSLRGMVIRVGTQAQTGTQRLGVTQILTLSELEQLPRALRRIDA